MKYLGEIDMDKKKLENTLVLTKKYIDFLAVVGVFYILLYQVEALRKICKAICQYIIEWYINVDLVRIREWYFGFEIFFRVIIVVSIISTLFMFIFKIITDVHLKNKTGENRFEESLFRYLHREGVSRSFLITGEWGSGKTYEVNQFFEKYYRWSNVNIYKISCFGLSSRKELVEEISNTIEQQDNSVYSLTIKVLGYLPVIGDAIGKLLRKSYGYDSVKKGSIFIFDDFERITSRAITQEKTRQLYRTTPLFYNHLSRNSSSIKEFEEVKKGFQEVENVFSQIENFFDKYYTREEYDKYIAIIGLINELIESYDMRVIIVCNSSVLGEKFIHDVLRSKLNCIEYKKTVSKEVSQSVLKDIMDNKEFEEIEKGKILSNYLSAISCQLDEFVQESIFEDLRLYNGLLEAFISTAVLFDVCMLTNQFLNSLFNSIAIVHQAYYGNSIMKLEHYVNGAYIKFLTGLFGDKRLTGLKLIKLEDSIEEFKWVRIDVSGYWILNLSKPNAVDVVFEEWKEYQYVELEDRMIKDYRELNQTNNFTWNHMVYYQKKINNNWNELFIKIDELKGYDYSDIEVVQEMLDIAASALTNTSNSIFENVLFSKLAAGRAEGEIIEKSYLHRRYKDYLKKTWG